MLLTYRFFDNMTLETIKKSFIPKRRSGKQEDAENQRQQC